MPIDVPSAMRTLVDAVLDSGMVSGTYRERGGASRAYVMDAGGCVTTIDTQLFPGIIVARGVNKAGALVGSYRDVQGKTHGYLLRGYPLKRC